MNEPSFILLYVGKPAASAAFYSGLLGMQPVESSPTFVLFALGNGLRFGLWGRAGVEPPAQAPAGAAEIALALGDAGSLRSELARLTGLGASLLQPPTSMDFGLTCTVADPDGHRIRLFVPAGR